jgi:hypothetical protein
MPLRRRLAFARRLRALTASVITDPGQWALARGLIEYSPKEAGMLDVIYILIGAVFLGGCVLYAIACEHL